MRLDILLMTKNTRKKKILRYFLRFLFFLPAAPILTDQIIIFSRANHHHHLPIFVCLCPCRTNLHNKAYWKENILVWSRRAQLSIHPYGSTLETVSLALSLCLSLVLSGMFFRRSDSQGPCPVIFHYNILSFSLHKTNSCLLCCYGHDDHRRRRSRDAFIHPSSYFMMTMMMMI